MGASCPWSRNTASKPILTKARKSNISPKQVERVSQVQHTGTRHVLVLSASTEHRVPEARNGYRGHHSGISACCSASACLTRHPGNHSAFRSLDGSPRWLGDEYNAVPRIRQMGHGVSFLCPPTFVLTPVKKRYGSAVRIPAIRIAPSSSEARGLIVSWPQSTMRFLAAPAFGRVPPW